MFGGIAQLLGVIHLELVQAPDWPICLLRFLSRTVMHCHGKGRRCLPWSLSTPVPLPPQQLQAERERLAVQAPKKKVD